LLAIIPSKYRLDNHDGTEFVYSNYSNLNCSKDIGPYFQKFRDYKRSDYFMPIPSLPWHKQEGVIEKAYSLHNNMVNARKWICKRTKVD